MADPFSALLTLEALGKLTVAQLKAICKEKKISAYSKLPKPGIIQKILGRSQGQHTTLTNAAPLINSPPRQHLNATESTAPKTSAISIQTSLHATPPLESASSQGPHGDEDSRSPALLSEVHTAVLTAILQSSISATPAERLPAKRKTAMGPPSNEERKKKKKSDKTSQHIPHMPGLSQVQRLPFLSSIPNREESQSSSVSVGSTRRSIMLASSPVPVVLSPSTMPKPQESSLERPKKSRSLTLTKMTRKRFVPLVIKIQKPPVVPQQVPLSLSSLPARIGANPTDLLDFAAPPSVSLLPVSMPPSLSQRKRVLRLSLAFSLVSLQDLYNLALCSRLFRYAVYISAGQRLARKFSGRRLITSMKQYSQSTTNMWPYLRARQEERITRQRIFSNSFLGKATAGTYTISSRLWTSPDHDKQATVAVRFLLTRLFFEISVGLEVKGAIQIVDAGEVVEGEIWSIESQSARGKERLFVLEATCEVIGRPEPCLDGGDIAQITTPLRTDWSGYVKQHHTCPRGHTPQSLLERLKWTNYEEYHRGISKLWLTRTRSEGEVGAAKRLVAERYILACVVSNSVSGRWMSPTELAQESSGLPSQVYHPREGATATVQLFLPAHHHVESLHFTSSSRQPFHSAVAVVQTPAREYFILRDNGMQIGCEEDGIAEVWMRMLECDAGGCPR